MTYHDPVLLQEAVDGLNPDPSGTYVDVTFGGGGHSREILKRLGPDGKLIAFDQDGDAGVNVPEDERFTLVAANFRYIKQYLKFYGIVQVDGILGDFGVSSHQFNQAERGFSLRMDAKLDMRMDQGATLTAKEVVNTYPFEALRELLGTYGELRKAAPMARSIVQEREKQPIVTTGQLNEVLKPHLERRKENKMLAQVYQAIRIEVNAELEALKEFLLQCEPLIRPGGRLSLISYHSLEDRLVKRFIRTGKFQGEVDKDFYGNPLAPFRKVGGLIVPGSEELERNPRSRSAKLRIAERVALKN